MLEQVGGHYYYICDWCKKKVNLLDNITGWTSNQSAAGCNEEHFEKALADKFGYVYRPRS